MFTQLRGEIDDVEERVRRDLVAASADLRAQLSASVREFETFRTGLLQTLEETNNAAAEARERQEQQIASETRAAVERLNAASADLHSQLSNSLREFEGFRTKVSKAGKKWVEDIEALVSASTERVEAVFNACDAQNRRTSDIMNTIASTAENMTKRFIETDLPGERLSSQLNAFTSELEQILIRATQRRPWPFKF
jgi:archaellum component FlaC